MSLKNYFNEINGIKVIIVGDVMIDSYVFGGIERDSPEAPVPIVNVNYKEKRIGGAANVALNIKSLGGIPYLCSCVGKDHEGKNFIELLKKKKLSNSSIIIDSKRKTTIKERVIVNNKHILRVDDENTENISKIVQNKLILIIKKLVNECSLLIFQDYNKGILTKDFINQIINFSKNKIKITVDPKYENFNSYKNIDLLKPNLLEACQGLKLDYKKITNNKLGIAAQKHLVKNKIKCIMITMSENGILIIDENNINHYKTFSNKIVDVSGAGDTVISVASICFCMSIPTNFLGYFSNLAGTIVCQTSGVIPINKKKLFKEAIKNDLDKYL